MVDLCGRLRLINNYFFFRRDLVETKKVRKSKEGKGSRELYCSTVLREKKVVVEEQTIKIVRTQACKYSVLFLC